MTLPENPPAFPTSATDDVYDGMSLRDWFAGQCAAAALVNATGVSEEVASEVFPLVARLSYLMADAMLAERRKDEGAQS
jgi:hypothetical protein